MNEHEASRREQEGSRPGARKHMAETGLSAGTRRTVPHLETRGYKNLFCFFEKIVRILFKWGIGGGGGRGEKRKANLQNPIRVDIFYPLTGKRMDWAEETLGCCIAWYGNSHRISPAGIVDMMICMSTHEEGMTITPNIFFPVLYPSTSRHSAK